MTYGVGFIGAGPVVQAIHLPTLARFRDTFHVAMVMDVNPDTAATVASRAGARSTASVEELLADNSVDVVAVCSPSQFHAAQVTAATSASKRVVLCEKPFAVNLEEADTLSRISAASGVPIVVGAMHTFDPGWIAAKDRVTAMAEDAVAVRSTVMIPPNARFEDLATEVHGRAPFPSGTPTDPDAIAARLEGGILGLASHDLPLIRRVTPMVDWVDVAQPLAPYGYAITYGSGDVIVELTAQLHNQWRPEWTLDVWTHDAAARIDFAPSYVHAGSATASLAIAGETVRLGPYLSNGYEEEWRHIAALCDGKPQRSEDLETELDDLRYALDLAAKVKAHVMKEGVR